MQTLVAVPQPAPAPEADVGPQLPALADLDAATAVTAAAIADPTASLAEVHRAAELEAATLSAYWHSGAEARAELEAGL